MEFRFKTEAENDLIFWHKNDKSVIKKIESLFKDMKVNPFFGLGKPEPLKGNFSGYWSRRINQEHRVILSSFII